MGNVTWVSGNVNYDDNADADAKSFLGLLKRERVHRRRDQTRANAVAPGVYSVEQIPQTPNKPLPRNQGKTKAIREPN
jgi:hypothetical protein